MNRTKATILKDVCEAELKKGDYGYIDGYITANECWDGESRPYAVFVRIKDGHIGLCPIYLLRADAQ